MKKYYLVEVYSGSNRVSKVFIRPKSLSSYVNKCLTSGYFVLVNSEVYLPTLKSF